MNNVTYTIHIRRNSDGKIVDLPWRSYWPEHPPWGDSDEYIWSDGNYGCDCNREIFWCRATGEDDTGRGCGESAYSIRITDPQGEVLYQDDDWEALTVN
jgi:hypothetical protein